MGSNIVTNHLNALFEDRLVREKERKTITGISRTACWVLEQKDLFPKRRKLNPLGGTGVCWLYSELLDWVHSREIIGAKGVE